MNKQTLRDEPMHSSSGVTFDVAPTKLEDRYPPRDGSVASFAHRCAKSGLGLTKAGTLLRSTEAAGARAPDFNNGFVGACFRGYSNHYHLKLSPDDIWIQITSSFSRYMEHNAEHLRDKFVDHEGKKELVVFGEGSILTADYDALIGKICDEIEKHTKANVRSWVECDFSTTSKHTRTVSKIVLMGAMKKFFSYGMRLCCGLPKVTLEGVKEDWEEIVRRVVQMREWEDKQLTEWSLILEDILGHFVAAFGDKPVEKSFWNRICHKTGGGSGPSYLEGWIVGLIAFTDSGRLVAHMDKGDHGGWGRLDTNDIPCSAVVVPVKIDDNGTKYDTAMVAGALLNVIEGDSIRPSLDWALIDVTGIPKRGA